MSLLQQTFGFTHLFCIKFVVAAAFAVLWVSDEFRHVAVDQVFDVLHGFFPFYFADYVFDFGNSLVFRRVTNVERLNF
jgi:hypothetical protein